MNKAKGTMSMKDVMESINKKNNMFKATSTVGSSTLVNATNPATATASGSTTTTTSSGEQPLENDVGQPATASTAAPSAVTSATTGQKKSIPKVRTPLAKRSPAMQLNDYVPGGGSLLKPLLATPTPTAKPAADVTKTEEPAAMLTNTLTTTSGSNPGAAVSTTPTPTSTASTTSITVSSLDALSKTDAAETTSTTSVTASALANHVGQDMVESNSKGRRRRDTDSSTKSDKSDISLLSVESGASSASNPTTKKQTGANKANTSAKARTAKGKYLCH